MTAALEALQASAPAAFLRTSFYAYPVVSALHILLLGALLTSALLMDFRVLGLGNAIPTPVVLEALRPVAMAALLGAVVTGALLFSVQPFDYLGNPAFQLKLVLLALAAGNALVFNLVDRTSAGEGPALKLVALLSILLWPAVLLSGRFIGFVGD